MKTPLNASSGESLRATAEYTFDLPDHLIATHPPKARGDSRLLVVQPGGRPGRPILQDCMFRDLPELLRAGDLLITNDTRVSHRRVRLQRATGGDIEALFLNPDPETSGAWQCLVRGLKKLRPGEILSPRPPGGSAAGADGVPTRAQEKPPGSVTAPAPDFEFLAARPDGKAVLRAVLRRAANQDSSPRTSAWRTGDAAEAFFEAWGEVPIPPYLGRASESLDRQRYQTVYAREPASVAAPTAGLHFNDTIIEEIVQTGAEFAALELRIGYGTFAPLTDEQFRTNRLHAEQYSIPTKLVDRLNGATGAGRRIAVGTTSLRALEANRRAFGAYQAGAYRADLFLRPPDRVTTVDALITNFHLPGSSLVMLVACMVERADLLAAYRHAIEREYRFFSYGDAMLVCGQAFCS
ncbi:MAG: tRNA preQ1(34) S-adenosylmethionine ribosyltransferase-isomerase QueA [Leptospirales bacterium]|jgi:S-adenosylmethionine:tRNA ribosyltransferase-isomerase